MEQALLGGVMSDVGARRSSRGWTKTGDGFTAQWEGLGDSIGDFGNEGVVFDERVIGERFGSADAEPDERQ